MINLLIFSAIAIGYAYSVFIGHFLLSWFSRTARLPGESLDDQEDITQPWTKDLVGMIDRVIYTSSILFDAKEFIVVWLAFSIAAQWKKWETARNKTDATFNLFVIGTGLSLIHGVLGGLIANWLKSVNPVPAITATLGAIILNVILNQYAYNQRLPRPSREFRSPAEEVQPGDPAQ